MEKCAFFVQINRNEKIEISLVRTERGEFLSCDLILCEAQLGTFMADVTPGPLPLHTRVALPGLTGDHL